MHFNFQPSTSSQPQFPRGSINVQSRENFPPPKLFTISQFFGKPRSIWKNLPPATFKPTSMSGV